MALLSVEQKITNRKKIGLIIQGQDVNANQKLIEGIKQSLDLETVELKILLTDNKFAYERKCLLSITENFDALIIDGVKASIMNPNLDCYLRFYQQGMRVIFYNNYYRDIPFPKIINNDHLCADKLIEILTKNGHSHIADIFLFDNYQGIEKYKGYVSSLLKYRAHFEDKYVKWCISDDTTDKNPFSRTLIKFLKSFPHCTAIVCCNYMLLQLVYELLTQIGKKVPDDYSVVCFDYSNSDWRERSVTSSIHPGFEMGLEIGKRIIRMIEDKDYKKHDYSYTFQPFIFEGSSVKNMNSK
ncbi:MAG: substrate-binding domain-containing protein [Treponema sp.]|jgi:GntR family transcriptional regulator of arabinose operon|nr:substrate-binding domain-containing protein [Treponema sp.]